MHRKRKKYVDISKETKEAVDIFVQQKRVEILALTEKYGVGGGLFFTEIMISTKPTKYSVYK